MHSCPPGVDRHGSRHESLVRFCPTLISLLLVSLLGWATPEEVLRHPPREGLERSLVKMGHTRPLVEPRRGPQAGKSGDPRSQDADRIC